MKTILFIASFLLIFFLYPLYSSESVATPAIMAPAQGFIEVITDLKAGNQRFAKGEAKHPAQDASARTSLLNSQAPKAIVLSCSDSRVPPEILFDKGIGEIFVVRNAGNIADYTTVASIEYAIEHLGSKVLVVMGHDSCGAVKATLGAKKGKSLGSPSLDQMAKMIEGNFVFSKGFSRDPLNPTGAIKANVRGVVVSLMKQSPIIREFVEKNELMIVQSHYHFDSGEVEFMDIGRPLLVTLKRPTVRYASGYASGPEH